MDAKVTGNFISTLRKEHNITQKQLAEKLNVSDKAISRWETGKGYPDIESLLALSNIFSVSINELLCGTRITNDTMADNAQKDIASAYILTAEKKQQIHNLAIALVILLWLSIVATIALAIYHRFPDFYQDVMGSPNCVIAADYSHMTLFGEQYVPLVLDGGTDCISSELLIHEAQVEGETFFGKLLFGDMIYSVRNCKNNDIIFLQSDSGPLQSELYCKASKLQSLQEAAANGSYHIVTAVIPTDNGYWDLTLNDTLSEMIMNAQYILSEDVNCDYSFSNGDKWIDIHLAQPNTPFIKREGMLLNKNGQYYWFDYDDIPPTQNNANYSGIKAYEIDDKYDTELDQLFSYPKQ